MIWIGKNGQKMTKEEIKISKDLWNQSGKNGDKFYYKDKEISKEEYEKMSP